MASTGALASAEFAHLGTIDPTQLKVPAREYLEPKIAEYRKMMAGELTEEIVRDLSDQSNVRTLDVALFRMTSNPCSIMNLSRVVVGTMNRSLLQMYWTSSLLQLCKDDDTGNPWPGFGPRALK